VRASFGVLSTDRDVASLVNFLTDLFQEKNDSTLGSSGELRVSGYLSWISVAFIYFTLLS